jgi:tripartite-type tricarboxylate transporter receptor subunit TctC
VARRWMTFGTGLLIAGAVMLPAQAQSVADFYRGKTINMLIGVGVGGEYDLQARLVARHLGKHIPGNPNVVPQNMIGAGGINMANHMYNTVARDGTFIAMMGNNFPATQAVGGKTVKFDAGKFQWLGTIAPVV